MDDPASLLSASQPEGRTRETRIRRDALGRWFNGEDPITHVLLTRSFDAWLVPAPDGSGRWALSNAINWAFVTLEGPPRFVRNVALDDDGGAELTLSDGRVVPLAPDTLREGKDGALYCEVPLEGVAVLARFDSAATMQLAGVIDEDDAGVFLRLGRAHVRPAPLD